MADTPRLIERAFPLRQASLDSLHEKNMRHGHISTLHIWPARRPLAASRAALIATLLPDPGTPDERQELLERIGGNVERRDERKVINGKSVPIEKYETVGGILHWGRESDPDLAWFRSRIREAFGGRAPRVLDPFAGGGAIPLEAMRLGCETTAVDVNPLAWLLLKCTIEFPQRLGKERRRLPDFALRDRDFMERYLEAQGLDSSARRRQLERLGLGADNEPMLGDWERDATLDADLAWHVRAWGHWVESLAREDLRDLYPAVDGSGPLAYLWARTIVCKNCRAAIPLLKTRWIVRKGARRILLTYTPRPDGKGVTFGLERHVPLKGGNAAQRREHDRRLAQATMSRSGAICPCCGAPNPGDYYQHEAQQGRLGAQLLAVVHEVRPKGKSKKPSKDYRLPSEEDLAVFSRVPPILDRLEQELPFGLPHEPISAARPSPNARGMSGLTRFGIVEHSQMYGTRQLASLAQFALRVHDVRSAARGIGYSEDWADALAAYLYCSLARLADRQSTLCTWQVSAQQINHVFARYALTMTTDYAEVAPFADSSGGYLQGVEWTAEVVEHLTAALCDAPPPTVVRGSAGAYAAGPFDVIITDPPYYDSVPYADVMDYFYVWARRAVGDRWTEEFATPLAPTEEEYIQHAGRLGGDNDGARAKYESNMERAFRQAAEMLTPDGRFVIVFAHKDPAAWGTLVGAIVRAGFTVDASWPIQTERASRLLALSSAALSSSVWLVCKKRPVTARPGWDNRVLDEMRSNISARLREYWDAGIRGPDFVWAATGPALEAYSKHPVVKKANEPSALMDVDEFLRAVRRIVVDFVVGRVLTHGEGTEVSGLDDVTTYYLLHRHDFGLRDAPIGPCILYAVSCGLSDSALADTYDLLVRTGGQGAESEADSKENEGEEDGADGEAEESGSGTMVKLKPWHQRKRPSMGYNPATDSARAKRAKENPALSPEFEAPLPRAREVPLIDQVHRLMHLWKGGDVSEVDGYLDARALRKNALFHHMLQALIELADAGSDERSILESLSNHVVARGGAAESPQLEARV